MDDRIQDVQRQKTREGIEANQRHELSRIISLSQTAFGEVKHISKILNRNYLTVFNVPHLWHKCFELHEVLEVDAFNISNAFKVWQAAIPTLHLY